MDLSGGHHCEGIETLLNGASAKPPSDDANASLER
jgi:hypothetical protein